MNFKGRANMVTSRHHREQFNKGLQTAETDKATRRALGTIYQVDPLQTGKSVCTVWIDSADGDRRLWGDGTEVVIINSPLDLLHRFGGIKSGMIVELFWRGNTETGNCHAHIVGEPFDDKMQSEGENIPDRDVDTASSLPFEPLGV